VGWAEEFDARTAAGRAFQPQPLDIGKLLAEGIEEPKFLSKPDLPAGVSIWAVGASESGKSVWGMAHACTLSRDGIAVVYVSQENPLTVELRRLAKLRPDTERLSFYHDQGFDLAISEHVEALACIAQGASLIVLDTFTACWSGDENDTAAVVGFDRDCIRPLIRETGAAVLTLDHTGHQQAFVRREGVSAPRGSSAKGQKADYLLQFKAVGPSEFLITHGKNRLGGEKEPPRQYRVVDDEDDETMALVQVETTRDTKVREVADAMVEFILATDGPVTTKAVRDAMAGYGGTELRSEALAFLEREDPPRVLNGRRQVVARDGKERPAKAWWPV
jgi:AAA domain